MGVRRKLLRELSDAGFELLRHGGNHDLYKNSENGKVVTVKRHDLDEDDAQYILKQAGLR